MWSNWNLWEKKWETTNRPQRRFSRAERDATMPGLKVRNWMGLDFGVKIGREILPVLISSIALARRWPARSSLCKAFLVTQFYASDCLSFSFRLNPGHPVDNWSNFNRLWWKWRKILKLGFGCWKITLRRVKMSFWGQRKSSQGQNRSFWPFPPISQKSKSPPPSCLFSKFILDNVGHHHPLWLNFIRI